MHYVFLVLIGAFFGSSAMCFKIISAELSVFTAVFLRFLIGSLVLIGVCIYTKNLSFPKKDIWKAILIGIVHFTIPVSLFCYAGKFLDSSIVSILNTMYPIFTIIFASVLLKENVTRLSWFGVIVSTLGIVILNSKDGLNIDAQDVVPSLCVVLATICYAVATIFVKTKCSNIPPVTNITVALTIATIPLVPSIFFETNLVALLKPKIFLIILYMGVCSTAIAYLLHFYLIKARGSAFSTFSSFLIPVFGIIYGIIFMNEVFTAQRIVGAIMVLFGLALILKLNNHLAIVIKKLG